MAKILSKWEGQKLVGAFMPPKFHNYISLYCVAKTLKKSDVVREPIQIWYEDKLKSHPEAKLIEDIIDILNSKIQQAKRENPNLNISEYKEKLEHELREKGVTNTCVFKIMNSIRMQS